MRSSIKVIQYTGWLALLFLILTYLVTINIETAFVVFNSPWMSDNFFLTVFGGAFASMLVVLLCEWQKYINTKNELESTIYFQTYFLYQLIYQMENNISEYQNNSNVSLPENFFDDLSQKMSYQINCLLKIDYIPITVFLFKHLNPIVIIHNNLQRVSLPLAEEILNAPNNLRIGIYKALINSPELNQDKTRINSSIFPVSTVLKIYKRKCSKLLHQLKYCLTVIDDNCNHKFNNENRIETMEKNCISILKAGKFEDFIKEEDHE